MKFLKRVSILAVLITVIAVFAGCGKEATVVGTWEGDDYTYTFNDDGTGIQQIGEISVSITSYEAKDGKLSRSVVEQIIYDKESGKMSFDIIIS